MLDMKIADTAIRFVDRLPLKQREQIKRKLKKLSENPAQNDRLKLKGVEDVWRVDVGEYRILYEIINTTIIVHVIGKRNDSDAYRKLLRNK